MVSVMHQPRLWCCTGHTQKTFILTECRCEDGISYVSLVLPTPRLLIPTHQSDFYQLWQGVAAFALLASVLASLVVKHLRSQKQSCAVAGGQGRVQETGETFTLIDVRGFAVGVSEEDWEVFSV